MVEGIKSDCAGLVANVPRLRWILVASLSLLAVALLTTQSSSPWSVQTASPPNACAMPAPHPNLNLTLKDTNGKDVRLANHRGNVVLIDFWATWCEPCKVEIPGFVRLADKYKARGFEVLGVVMLDQFVKAKPFAQRFKMPYPVLNGVDREDVEKAFGPMFALPTSLLLTRDGAVCHKHVGLPSTKSDKPIEQAVEDVFDAEIRSLL